MVLISDLEGRWNDYINSRVSDVDEIRKFVFHSVIGSWLNESTVYVQNSPAGRIVPRTHVFIISGSRTGKGMVMQMGHYACRDLGLKSDYMSGNLTPKALIGGLERISDRTGKITGEIERRGYLGTQDYIAWSEGKEVLRSGKNTDFGSTKDVLLNALDDPGYVKAQSYTQMYQVGEKTGKLFGYETRSSVLTGTIYFNEINDELLSSGILQRFFLVVSQKTAEEYLDFLKKVGKMIIENEGKINSLLDTNPFATREQIIDFKTKEMHDFTSVLKNVKRKNYVRSNANIRKDFNETKLYPFFDEIKENLPRSGQQLEAVNAFIISLYTQIDKIAAQKAMIEGREITNLEDFDYGFDTAKLSLKSVFRLLNLGFLKTETDANAKRARVVTNYLTDNLWCSQSTILSFLKQMRVRNEWDLGTNKSLAFLKELVENEIVIEKKSGDGNKYCYGLKNQAI
jgi:hypothetical protein